MFKEILLGTYVDQSQNLTKQLRYGEISRQEYTKRVNQEALARYKSIRFRGSKKNSPQMTTKGTKKHLGREVAVWGGKQ